MAKIKFSSFLRKRRLQIGLTLREFARQAAVSASYISFVEMGKQKPPSENTIAKMAIILQVDFDYLLAIAGKISEKKKQEIINNILNK